MHSDTADLAKTHLSFIIRSGDNQENYMQLAIELPDELGKQVLKHPNAQEFVKTAIERLLLEEKALTQNIPPKTKSLVGLMSDSAFDEADYKQHLESKYL